MGNIIKETLPLYKDLVNGHYIISQINHVIGFIPLSSTETSTLVSLLHCYFTIILLYVELNSFLYRDENVRICYVVLAVGKRPLQNI